jgi:hypothetical protein
MALHWTYTKLKEDLVQAKYNMTKSGIKDKSLFDKIDAILKEIKEQEIK